MADWNSPLPDTAVVGEATHVEDHNRIVAAITEVRTNVDSVEDAAEAAPTWASVTGKPATFAPTVGTTAATALAGNTALLAIGTTATTAAAGNHTHTVAQVTGLQAVLDAKATAAALADLAARVEALEAPEA